MCSAAGCSTVVGNLCEYTGGIFFVLKNSLMLTKHCFWYRFFQFFPGMKCLLVLFPWNICTERSKKHNSKNILKPDWPGIDRQHNFKTFFIQNANRDHVATVKGLKKIKYFVSLSNHQRNHRNPSFFATSSERWQVHCYH